MVEKLGVSELDMYRVWAIFRKPRMLTYEACFDKQKKKYGLDIRDEDGVLFSSGPVASSREEVLEVNQHVLERVLGRIEDELADESSPTSKIFNRNGKARDCHHFLSHKTINEIITQLRVEGVM